MRNRSAESILEAHKQAFTKLKTAGLTPKLARVDNECSNALKEFLHEEQVDYQLVPPLIHRHNAAERAIRTFKNHFVAGLASCDPMFPLHLWDRLLPQALLTLNILQGSRFNPQLSAHAQVMGDYHYKHHPIAPPGMQVMVHEKPSQRKSWAPHAKEGWYVGPAMEHFRCYHAWMKDTKHLRTTDTVTFLPTQTPQPIPTDAELVKAAINDITNIIKKQQPQQTSLVTQQHMDTLKQAQQIFDPSYQIKTEETPAYTPPPPESKPYRPRTRSTTFQDGNHTLSAAHNRTNKVLNTPLLRVGSPLKGTQSTQGYAAAILHIAQQEHTAQTLNANNAIWEETCYKAIHPDSGKQVEYKELLNSSKGHLWTECCAEEIGRLAQGYKCTIGTNTRNFIQIQDIPNGRKPAYLRLVVADRPNKDNPKRV
jgi:hypothetical protein